MVQNFTNKNKGKLSCKKTWNLIWKIKWIKNGLLSNIKKNKKKETWKSKILISFKKILQCFTKNI